MLTTVEKVLFLQGIDIFEHTLTADLAQLAAIADEITLKSGQAIFKEGDFPDAMYMVIDGKVRLTRENRELMLAESKDFFGTWALFDEEPRVASAFTLEECRLLKIDKEEFFDLLADNVNITQSIFKTFVKRLRNLMSRIEK